MVKWIIAAIMLLPIAAQAKSKEITLTTSSTVVARGVILPASTIMWQLAIKRVVTQRGNRDYPIYLVLDSPGGSVDAGLSFIEFAKTIKNMHTITIFAASMGSAIVEHLPGTRYISENGVLMFHRASGTFQGQFEDGEVESVLNFWKLRIRQLELKTAKRLKMPLADYKKKAKDEWWLTAGQSIHKKAADQTVNIKCTARLINKKEHIISRARFFDVAQSFSGCPLFRSPLPGVKK